jgi:putative radical SAM enzyme (TIGR03279 family)
MSRMLIKEIEPGSIAEEAGIEKGDALISVNRQEILDIFDYRFLTANEKVTVEILKKDGETWEIEIEKEEYEDLGIEFEEELMDEVKSCSNKCIFCFIDQLPPGMRSTLYFKDDDSRMSFLTGNYVTLTNIRENEFERIIRYKMSPINISVHTTNPELRVRMLRNRFAGDILEKIKRLTEAGITVNTQIVLCKGINDGKELDRTINDLSSLYPGVLSTSVVPVGLTRWRKGLFVLLPFNKSDSVSVINQVEIWQNKLLAEKGSRAVYLADEFYIMAEKELPPCEDYEGFPQIENGVGMMPLFMEEFYGALEKVPGHDNGSLSIKRRHVSIATGVLAYKYIKEMATAIEKRYNGIKINVFPIMNDFFGENVTVTGLITGKDIINQLKGEDLGNGLLLARNMLKADREVLLDDCTVEMLESSLKTKVAVVENDGRDFLRKILFEVN